MAMNDQVSDFLTRIRNAIMAKHRYVDVRLTKMNKAIVEVLKENRFIDQALYNDEKVKIRIFLRYTTGRCPVMSGLKRESRPGVRKYVNTKQIPTILKGLGIAILSTPKGVLDGQKARKENVGGELLCSIW